MIVEQSHYRDLLQYTLNSDRTHAGFPKVEVLPPLMPRKDGIGIFEEGRSFSGMYTEDEAEACITPTASPHFAPTLPTKNFLQASEHVLGKAVVLPDGMEDVPWISPQLIIWWRNTQHQNGYADFTSLIEQSATTRKKFTRVIDRSLTDGFNIIHQAAGQPVIWGTWGHGLKADRLRTGKNRGGPTLKDGHCHVSFVNPAEQIMEEDLPLSHAEKINHYAPWNVLFHEKFQTPGARFIHRNLLIADKPNDVTVTPLKLTPEKPNHNQLPGYKIAFATPLSIEDIFHRLMNFAGAFESIYQTFSNEHERFYSGEDQLLAARNIFEQCAIAGFRISEAEEMTEFIIRTRPTYTQVETFFEDAIRKNDQERIIFLRGMKEKYERVYARLQQSKRESFSKALLRDTVTPSDCHPRTDITWPVHASATYVMDDIHVHDEKPYVKSMKLYPNFVTTEAASERINGCVLKRALPVYA